MTDNSPFAETSRMAPIRAEHPVLSSKATVAESFSALAEAALTHLARNAEAFEAMPEPHAVHQMRVAARRLRALLGAFRSVLPKTARKRTGLDLKRLQKALSPARDLDVFLDEVLADVAVANVRMTLAQAARVPHKRAYGRVSRMVRSSLMDRVRKDFDGLATALARTKDGESAGRSFARAILLRRHKALSRRLGGAKRRSDKRLHALRIRIKKLRYEVEFFRPLMPRGGVVAYHAALAESQDVLGAFNDAVNARALAGSLAADLKEIDSSTRDAIDAVFAAAEDRARPVAQRKFAIQQKALANPPKRWFR
jgi:CHAD domain-containing protein